MVNILKMEYILREKKNSLINLYRLTIIENKLSDHNVHKKISIRHKCRDNLNVWNQKSNFCFNKVKNKTFSYIDTNP